MVLGLLCTLLPAHVLAADPPGLIISQFKITSSDGQFFLLHNATDAPIDMNNVQLVYYNHYNLASATSSKIITLSGSLPARGYYLVNDGPLTLCYRMLINSVSLGLSSTAGHVEVQRLSQPSSGAPLENTTEDAVSWSKTAATGATQLPTGSQFSYRLPVDSNNNPAVTTAGGGSWRTVSVDPLNPCLYASPVTTIAPPVISTSLLLLSSTPPPVSFLQEVISGGPSLPLMDIGLMAPIVNELLPNPGDELSDAEDEFIELYNPNDKPFDLTGFQLEVGATTKRTWTFPVGTLLAPKSFTAFYSSATNLSLSNSSSMVQLLDPFGNGISAAPLYTSAKENQTWALANNSWVWTTKPTPNAANIVTTPPAAQTKARATTTANGTAKAASTGNIAANVASEGAEVPEKVAQLHPSALASVAALAVGYGIYEYKQDIANRLRQFRSNRAARRGNRG